MSDVDDDGESVTEFLDPSVVRAKARVGQTLGGKWRLDVLLGLGGMAAVYAATHRNGSRAAVKVLHAELSANEEVLSRFMREGYAANTVAHAGVVKVLDDDVSSEGEFYLVTELLDGETLDERRLRNGGRLGEDEVLSVADLLLDVLVAAHAKGVIHRDIKPANVFLTRAGQLKVLDFGIARLRELSSPAVATKSGSALGTPAFMSPEQARGLWSEVDGRSDIWSVGATMWEALTGRLVHLGRTPNEELLSAMTKAAPSIASVRSSLSPAVVRVIDRALAFEKEQRWLDARRMQEGVRRAYYDRNGAEITTAPRMTVPETVPDRTVGSAATEVSIPRAPTTGRPIARSQFVAPFLTPPRRLLAVSALGGSLLGLGVLLAVFGARSPGRTVTAGVLPSAAASTRMQPVAPSSEESAPRAPWRESPAAVSLDSSPSAGTAVDIAALPPAPPETAVQPPPAPSPAPPLPSAKTPSLTVAAETPKVAKALATVQSVPSPPASGEHAAIEPVQPQAAPKPDCTVPYTLDPATGKKHFRVECL